MDAGQSFDVAMVDSDVDLPRAPGGLGLDPRTGLASDFLNQFAEAVALLDLAAQGELFAFDELASWRPRPYADYFAGSRFDDAARVLDAWNDAPSLTRRRIEAQSDEFGTVVIGAAAFLNACYRQGAAESATLLASGLARDARERLKRLDALVHAGRKPPSQASVSALFARRAA